jgi:hypothetical protein
MNNQSAVAAMTSSSPSILQTAIPAAILKANKQVSIPEKKSVLTMATTARKIFETFKDFSGEFLVSELQDHLEPFGYSAATVASTVSNMFTAGLLTRSQKMPYAYSWVSGAKEPSDKQVAVKGERQTRKQLKDLKVKGQKEKAAKENSLPPKTIRKAINGTTGSLAGVTQDLINQMAVVRTEGMDKDYDDIKLNIQTLVTHLENMGDQIRGVQSMAAAALHKNAQVSNQTYKNVDKDLGDMIRHLKGMWSNLDNLRRMSALIRCM